MSIVNPKLTGVAARIFEGVVNAMQPAEELGAPEGAEYFSLMSAIAAEATARMHVYGATIADEAADARHARNLVRQIGDALGTGEGGDALVGVASNAAGAERRLAALETAVGSVDVDFFDNADNSVESIVAAAVDRAEWRQAETEPEPNGESERCNATIPGGGFAEVSFCSRPRGHEGTHL